MSGPARFAEVAALAGNPARAVMLNALLDGRAFTANELSRMARVAPQTGSGHLARLAAAGLITVERRGRHRYHRLASPAVAHMLEAIMLVASDDPSDRLRMAVGPRDAAMRAARTCYDHLAGRLGVDIAAALVARGHVELDWEAGLVTDSGLAFLARIGADVAALTAGAGRRPPRAYCRPCLDWSERRPHLAGAVGGALRTACFANGWIRRTEGSRAVAVTPPGRLAFRELLGFTPAG